MNEIFKKFLWKYVFIFGKLGWANFKVVGSEQTREGWSSKKMKVIVFGLWWLPQPWVGALASTNAAGLGIMGTSGRGLMVQPKDLKI